VDISLAIGNSSSRASGSFQIPIDSKLLRQNLQGHLPVQLGIGGLIDLAHAPLANPGGDVIVAESRADVEGRHGLS